jgi:hypothetical protein
MVRAVAAHLLEARALAALPLTAQQGGACDVGSPWFDCFGVITDYRFGLVSTRHSGLVDAVLAPSARDLLYQHSNTHRISVSLNMRGA